MSTSFSHVSNAGVSRVACASVPCRLSGEIRTSRAHLHPLPSLHGATPSQCSLIYKAWTTPKADGAQKALFCRANLPCSVFALQVCRPREWSSILSCLIQCCVLCVRACVRERPAFLQTHRCIGTAHVIGIPAIENPQENDARQCQEPCWPLPKQLPAQQSFPRHISGGYTPRLTRAEEAGNISAHRHQDPGPDQHCAH